MIFLLNVLRRSRWPLLFSRAGKTISDLGAEKTIKARLPDHVSRANGFIGESGGN